MFYGCLSRSRFEVHHGTFYPSYVNNGSTAKLVWDYSDPQKQLQGIVFYVLVDAEFVKLLVNQSGVVKEHKNIPSIYKGRVRIEGNATLVIEYITPKDNTKFRCKMFGPLNPESTVQLIVAGLYYSSYRLDN